MSKIKLTQIAGSDSIASSRITLNNNFQITEDIINTILDYLNTDTKTLSGFQTLKLIYGNQNTPMPSVKTFETNGSIVVDGNITCRETITAKNLHLLQGSGISLDDGNLFLKNPTSLAKFFGGLEVGGSLVYNSYSKIIQAWKKASYIGAGNQYEGVSPNIIGYIYLSQRAVILDFSGYNASDPTLNVRRIKLITDQNLKIGQEARIIFLLNESAVPSYTVQIEPTNIAYTTTNPITTGIIISRSYTVIDFVYSGTNWIITNIYGSGVTIQ